MPAASDCRRVRRPNATGSGQCVPTNAIAEQYVRSILMVKEAPLWRQHSDVSVSS